MDSPQSSSVSSEPIMGSHEEWPELSQGSSQDEKQDIKSRDQLEFELAHAQWHNLIYRTALLSVEGGVEAASRQLEAVKIHQRPLCGECEKDELIRKLADATRASASPVLCSNPAKKRRCRVERRSMST